MLQWFNACDSLEELTTCFFCGGLQAQTHLSQILSHLRPTALKVLDTRMFAGVSGTCGPRPRCRTYGIGRSDFLDSLGPLEPLLKKFTHLEQFKFNLSENNPAYDQAWWTAHILEKLPSLKGVLQLKILRCKSNDAFSCEMLWVPDEDHVHPQDHNEPPEENERNGQGPAGPLPVIHST
ncbi:hypothetical protein OH77DRAFT_1301863 [Trametes cingulata]|nr:hypothetical protein OH77DRAFT_1301863 [Trametes cingulata]